MHRPTNPHKRKTPLLTTAARPCKVQADQSEVVFADEHAKIAWEVGQAVARIIPSIPPEVQNLKARTICFDQEHLSRGTYAIFFSGSVIGTDREGVFLVPERSLEILEQLSISYHLA